MLAALVVTAALAALLLAAWPVVDEFLGFDVVLAAALVLGAVGYAVQYPVRGRLSAERRYGWYASVLGAEAAATRVSSLALVALADPGPGVWQRGGGRGPRVGRRGTRPAPARGGCGWR